jgi:molecular chaperone IbpA
MLVLPKGASYSFLKGEEPMNAINLDKFFVGFDNFASNPLYTQQAPEYPRYNIEKVKDGYEVQVAVPGWKKEQVSVNVHKNILSIKGEKKECNEGRNWVHKGISGKSFEKHLKLDNSLEVTEATMEHGMLVICLTYSPSSKPTSIPIG